MKGIVKKLELKKYSTKDNKKTFTKFEFTCDVKMDDAGSIKTLRGSYSEDFARRYFAYCEKKTKDVIGTEVECVLAKRSYKNDKGEERIISFIRFMNILDAEGKPIIMPKDNQEELDF